MKRQNKWIVALFILMVLVLGMAWLLRTKQSSKLSTAAAPHHASTGASPTLAAQPIATVNAQTPQERQSERGKFGQLSKLSAVSIQFFGRVVDQDGAPLAHVEVVGGTGSTTGFMQQEVRSYTTTTDKQGYFSFTGIRGDALIIDLKKAGYNFKSDRVRFHYSSIDPDRKRFTPDRDNPVLFRMWRSLGAEPIIQYHGRSIRAPADGSPVQIDLAKGVKVASGGDLLVSAKWGRRDGPDDMTFDWLVRIEAVDGGVIEEDEDVQFIAPGTGYNPYFEYPFLNDKEGHFRKTYYVMSQNGKRYARLELSVERQVADSDTRFTMRVWINPNGSRNLESDSSRGSSVP